MVKRNKYYNHKVTTADGTFDSKAEYKRWNELKALEHLGKISDLKRQVEYELIPKQALPHPYLKDGRMQKTERALKYIADFTYIEDGELVVEDVKGMRDAPAEYTCKRKLMLFLKGIQIREIRL